MDLRKALNLAYVPRWTICATLRQQSVAEHSFNVACIAWEIARRMVGDTPDMGPASLVALCALHHDLEEAETGDIPSTSKKHEVPGGVVEYIVALADVLEAITWWKHWGADGPTRSKEGVEKYLDAKFARLVDECGRSKVKHVVVEVRKELLR